MKSIKKIFYIVVVILMTASCSSNSPLDKIIAMEKNLDTYNSDIQRLESVDFPYLVDKYFLLDTTVGRKTDISQELDLLQAYLQQFDNEKFFIRDEILVSKKQLSDLKEDVKSGIYDEKTLKEYIQTEHGYVNKIGAKVKYFDDRFSAQKKIMQQLQNK